MLNADYLVSTLYTFFREVPQGTLSDEQYELNALLHTVRLVHSDFRKRVANNEAAQERFAYCFVSPEKDEVTVPVSLFNQFIQEYNLDRSEMVRVAHGEIKEHKGWRRSTKAGGVWVGQIYKEPRPELDEQRQKDIRDAAKEQRRLKALKSRPLPDPPKHITYSPSR